MHEITLKSGHVLALGMADFEDGIALFQLIVNEVKSSGMDFSEFDLKDVKEIGGKDLGVIMTPLLQVVGSKAVLAAVFACAKKSTLEQLAITRTTFSAPEYRADFLPCAWEVIKFNLAPFFANLDLSSLTSGAPPAGSPPSG